MIKISTKMWLIILHIGLLIVRNYALLNMESLSSYPLRDKYSKLLTDVNADVDEKCPGFKCNLSGLNAVQIADIIETENSIRDKYARENNVTNIYSVQWNPFLATLAKARSILSCLLPATGNTTIYEHVTNEFTQNDSSLEDWPTAVETVIGSRTFARKDRDELLDSPSEFIELFNKNDNISNPLERRGGTVDMGCSYLVTANQTHNTDYMLCLYGYLYFDPNTTENKYNNEIGTPCSKCTFYSNHEEISEMSGQQWNCGNRYSHTCSNLSKRQTQGNMMNPNQFDCKSKISNKLKKNLFLPSQHGELQLDPNDSIAAEYNTATKPTVITYGGLISLLTVILNGFI